MGNGNHSVSEFYYSLTKSLLANLAIFLYLCMTISKALAKALLRTHDRILVGFWKPGNLFLVLLAPVLYSYLQSLTHTSNI